MNGKGAGDKFITIENNALPEKLKTSLDQMSQSTQLIDDENEVARAFQRQFYSIMEY